jgi:hypothetical protein
MIPAFRPTPSSAIRFGQYSFDNNYQKALQKAVEWTSQADEVGVYEAKEPGRPFYHIVSGPDLAEVRHQPSLVVLQRQNKSSYGQYPPVNNFLDALQKAMDWTHWKDEVGVYETSQDGYSHYQVVSGPDLAAAQNRHQPDLLILQRHNKSAK